MATCRSNTVATQSIFEGLEGITQVPNITMRTSIGGPKLPEWNRDKWICKTETGDNCFKCPDCDKIFWLIANPSPNTMGGTKQMQSHQRHCWD